VALLGPPASGATEPLADQPWFTVPLAGFLDHPGVVALGWSREGFVALLVPDPGASGPVVRLVLFDAVDDQSVFDVVVRADPGLPTNQSDQWARNLTASDPGAMFLQKCRDYGVQPLSPGPTTLTPFPFTFRGSSVDARTASTPRGPRLVVAVAGRGEKAIANGAGGLVTTILGYVLSPYEPRIVVVYQPGEGPYRFSGCHLEVGFTKP